MKIGLNLGMGQGKAAGTPTPTPSSTTLEQLNALLAGNSSVVDFTTATGTTGTYNAQDLTALNNDWGQDDGGQAPALSATLGANFTVSNANSTLPVTAGTYTMVVSAILDASDISSYLLAAGAGTQEVLRLIQGNGTVMPFPTEVDGVATATRGDTWAAAAIGTEVVIMVTGVDPSGSGFLSVGRPGGQTHLPGSVRRAVVIDETAVTGGNLTTARADAKTWVAE